MASAQNRDIAGGSCRGPPAWMDGCNGRRRENAVRLWRRHVIVHSTRTTSANLMASCSGLSARHALLSLIVVVSEAGRKSNDSIHDPLARYLLFLAPRSLPTTLSVIRSNHLVLLEIGSQAKPSTRRRWRAATILNITLIRLTMPLRICSLKLLLALGL